jgi:hypothetical protein
VLPTDFSIHCSLVLHGNLFLLLVVFRENLLVVVSLLSLLESTLFLKHLLFVLVHAWTWIILSMNLFALLRQPLVHLLCYFFLLHCLLIYRHCFKVIIHGLLLPLPRVQHSSLLFPVINIIIQVLFIHFYRTFFLFIRTTVSLLIIRSVEFVCAVLEFLRRLLSGLLLTSASRSIEFILISIVGFSHASLTPIIVASQITPLIYWFSSQLS